MLMSRLHMESGLGFRECRKDGGPESASSQVKDTLF